MRSKFLLGLVVMMLMQCRRWQRRSRSRQWFCCWFSADTLGVANDVDVDYSITFGADTANLLPGPLFRLVRALIIMQL